MKLRVSHRSRGIGFPGDADGKECACNAGYLGSIPGQEDLLEKEMAVHSGEFNEHRSLVGFSLWDHKELDMTERLTLEGIIQEAKARKEK